MQEEGLLYPQSCIKNLSKGQKIAQKEGARLGPESRNTDQRQQCTFRGQAKVVGRTGQVRMKGWVSPLHQREAGGVQGEKTQPGGGEKSRRVHLQFLSPTTVLPSLLGSIDAADSLEKFISNFPT